MRKFIADLMTNRFGIVLAALNVCYLASRKFVSYAFSHGNAGECVFYKNNAFLTAKSHFADAMFNINSPAAFASLIQGKFTQLFFPIFVFSRTPNFKSFFLRCLLLSNGYLSVGRRKLSLAPSDRIATKPLLFSIFHAGKESPKRLPKPKTRW